jgi:hypothetical protein
VRGPRENELLRLAEVGAAVEWGSPARCAAADVVIAGRGPGADTVPEIVAAIRARYDVMHSALAALAS